MNVSRCTNRRRSPAGFTLIELLVVMAILGALAGLAAVTLPSVLRNAEMKSMLLTLNELGTVLEAYQTDPKNGDYPPTLMNKDDFPGVGVLTNTENCGIESVMICTNRLGRSSDFNVESHKNVKLDNLDGDRTSVALTNFGTDNRELYEILDSWDTPIAYFHWRDYGIVDAKDLGKISGPDGVLKCKPYVNPKTKLPYNRSTFQLISAGADREFNTEDDVTNFERE